MTSCIKNPSSCTRQFDRITIGISMSTYVISEYALKIHTSLKVPLPSNSVQTPQLHTHHRKKIPIDEPNRMKIFIRSRRCPLNWKPMNWYSIILSRNHTTRMTFANQSDPCFSCLRSSHPLNG